MAGLGDFLAELFAAAPHVDWTLLRVLARLVSSEVSSGARVEALLIVSDALTEASRELLAGGDHRGALELMALAGLVRQRGPPAAG